MKPRQLLPTLVVLLTAALPLAAQTAIFVSPDVPTDPDGPATYLPWEVVRHAHGSPAPYSLEFGLPGDPAIDALHKMDTPDQWLVSVEVPNDFAGLLSTEAEPRDVIRVDVGAGAASVFFDGDCVVPPLPLDVSIDGLYLENGDSSSLVVSFDVPTTLGGTDFLPSELVRFRPVGPGACGWLLDTSVIDFAATLGVYYPTSTNVTGVDRVGGEWIIALDVPVDVGPPGISTFVPGEIVRTDGLSVTAVDSMAAEGSPGWPVSSIVDALSCQANPGRIDPTVNQITLGKSTFPDIEVFCPDSCSSGGEEYGLYEGSIASINAGGSYDHVLKHCDVVCAGSRVFTPAVTSSYYLLVPHNHKEEGSYNNASNGTPRPQPAAVLDRCVEVQNLTPCP